MLVDGKSFLLLGAQINNSSSWATSLPAAWTSLEALHVNTVEAPVYWEQMEAVRGKFDFSNVDLLVNEAREHHLRVVLLWFGTWKNGQNHYVPEWVKSDPRTYPREISSYGKLLDVMSPNSAANLDADKHWGGYPSSAGVASSRRTGFTSGKGWMPGRSSLMPTP